MGGAFGAASSPKCQDDRGVGCGRVLESAVWCADGGIPRCHLYLLALRGRCCPAGGTSPLSPAVKDQRPSVPPLEEVDARVVCTRKGPSVSASLNKNSMHEWASSPKSDSKQHTPSSRRRVGRVEWMPGHRSRVELANFIAQTICGRADRESGRRVGCCGRVWVIAFRRERCCARTTSCYWSESVAVLLRGALLSATSSCGSSRSLR